MINVNDNTAAILSSLHNQRRYTSEQCCQYDQPHHFRHCTIDQQSRALPYKGIRSEPPAAFFKSVNQRGGKGCLLSVFVSFHKAKQQSTTSIGDTATHGGGGSYLNTGARILNEEVYIIYFAVSCQPVEGPFSFFQKGRHSFYRPCQG